MIRLSPSYRVPVLKSGLQVAKIRNLMNDSTGTVWMFWEKRVQPCSLKVVAPKSNTAIIIQPQA